VTRADGLARAEGAFSPAQLWEYKDQLLYDISVRNGIPPAFRRDHTITSRLLEPPPSDPTAGLGLNSELVDGVVKDLLT
jgi:hypothetical protein